MISRQVTEVVIAGLRRQAAVVLVGTRQTGQATLALEVASGCAAGQLEHESRADRQKHGDRALFRERLSGRLVVHDEIRHTPEIFRPLRGLIDRGRREGRAAGRFLMLGSASMDPLRRSSESLAGRIEHMELGPLNILAVQGAALVGRRWNRRLPRKLSHRQ